MSLCINPGCSKPENPDDHKFCQACGSELLLLSRYRVTQLLSNKGGFGYTYEVRDNDTAKVLKVLINDHPHAAELFRQEAEVLKKLNHPGIPKGENYFNYFTRDKQTPLHCLLMEKIEGIDLEEYQIKHNFYPIDQTLALEWLSQLINILHEVHRRNFFHRDIKPSNIILKPNGLLSLIDFGAVRQVTATIITGGQNTGIYTPGYAPPEQERGYAVPQSDFYALGRTFVYLLTGKEPNDAAIYDYNNNELNWRKLAPQIESKLADFIDHLMADKVIQRPADTTLILQNLSQLKQSLLQIPTSSSPPTVFQTKTVTQKKYTQGIVVPSWARNFPLWSKWQLLQRWFPSSTPQGSLLKNSQLQQNQIQYAGFWLRFKAAIIDEIIVMSLAAFLGGYLSFKLKGMGVLAQWGFSSTQAIKDFILWSSLGSVLGTTFLGYILISLWCFVLVFPGLFADLLALKLDDNIVQLIIGFLKNQILWLAPLMLGGCVKWIYFVIAESIFKATLGKYILKLQVKNLQGKRLSLKQANKRYWGKVLSTLPLYLGFILVGLTKRKRALHDWLAGSIIVKK